MKNVRTHIYPSIDIKLKGRKSNAHISSILHESRNYTAPPILQTNPSWVCPCEKINHSSICAVQAALVLGLSINQTTARPSNVRQSDSDDPAHLVDWVTFEILVTMWWISRATGRKTFPPPDCRWAGRITSLINSALLAAPTETFTSKKEKKTERKIYITRIIFTECNYISNHIICDTEHPAHTDFELPHFPECVL